jgi:hypothetical protein
MLAAMRGLAIAIVLAVTRIARAEPAPTDEARAAEIFQQGRELAKAGQIDEACARFDQSYALDPALGTALNLADCLEHQGHLRRAWELFDVVARNSSTVPSRAQLARQRATALVARLATVVLRVHDAGAPGLSIQLGDQRVQPAPEVRALIEPSDVALVVSAPGQSAWTTRVHGDAGATLTVDVPALVALHDARATETRRRRSRVYLAGGLGAAGVAGLGVALGLALSAKHGYDGAFDGGGCVRAEPSARCTPDGKATIDRAGQRADLATGFAIGGVVLAGVAAALWWTAPDEMIQVAPIATAGALGVGVGARF